MHSFLRTSLFALALAVVFLEGCSTNQILDFAMHSAPRSVHTTTHVGPYLLLAGDMHCHVLPPDASYHVSRELPETARLAMAEGLDFVVLTPHVPARFFLDPEERRWVHETQQTLRAHAKALAPTTTSLLIPGMEYTDGNYGHLGLSFADVDVVLDELPVDVLLDRPELFFERWQAHGGIATINHPVLRPLPHAPVRDLRYDLSWRGFPRADTVQTTGLPTEIKWLSEHADAIETHNLAIGHMRDQFMIGDVDWTMREGTHLVDRISRSQERRITPVGGTDSHGMWLRPTTWVLASERTPSAIHDAILAGRTCVRAPEACSLEVRGGDDDAFHFVGASLKSRAEHVEARAAGGDATYFVNGEIAAHARDGELVTLPTFGRCALVRVVVGASYSAPVYVDCDWSPSSP